MKFPKNCVILTALVLSTFFFSDGSAKGAKVEHPNILFVVMDDVGIDQFQESFGFGFASEGSSFTPMMDTIASEGLRFRNVWSEMECSPARAAMLTGRYSLRTHVYAIIQAMDLANSQVSPYEMTLPKVLKRAGYTTALFGKLHIGGASNFPNGDQSPTFYGFDYFHGPMGGTTGGAAPDPIDTTAGGVAPEGTYPCGFIPNRDGDPVNGSDNGACYFADSRPCAVIARTVAEPHPGRACLERGGLFVPDASCEADRPSYLNFELTNAYYAWSFGENDPADNIIKLIPLTDPRSRTYSSTELTTAAIDWINGQQNGPWMAMVSYASVHAPYQPAPQSLTPDFGDLGNVDCSCGDQAPTLSSQMLQAMDTEIGRLLVETGLASQGGDRQLYYTPAASNTMIVIIGDNGSYGPIVKAPFDWSRAKGTAFQTGVWVPLIVAGPLVDTPNRNVDSMVNAADLFELFGEIAGLDVRKIVPSSRVLDSVSMLPYLKNPSQPSLRQYNFAQYGLNFTANGERPGPCVLPMALFDWGSGNTCMQLMLDQETCEGEGGTWYGENDEGNPSYSSCCELIQQMPELELQNRWLAQEAVRNDTFKLVRTTYENCLNTSQNDILTMYTLYAVDETTPKLDSIGTNLITNPNDPTQGLTHEQARNYKFLKRELDRILASEVTCPGDGNNDGVVDEEDISNWASFNGMGSSWYDFPRPNSDGVYVYDGVTDESDLQVILDNLGSKCPVRNPLQ